MNIIILSDIHDHVWALRAILHSHEAAASDEMICCGDLCAPFIIDLLAEFGKPVHMVLGNNDGDVAAMISKLPNYPQIKIHGEYFRGELDGKTFAVNHYPDKAQKLADLQQYDVVCYGHDHQAKAGHSGKTLLLNPGAVMGFHGPTLSSLPHSFMTLDTENLEVHAYTVAGFEKDPEQARVNIWEQYSMAALV